MFNTRTSRLVMLALIATTLTQTSLQKEKKHWCKPLPKGTDPDEVACPQIYDPVCAYDKDDAVHGTTLGNSCVACDQEGYDYYYDGVCPGTSQEEEEGTSQEASEGSNQEASEGSNQEEGSEGNNQEASEGSNQEEGSEGSNQEASEGSEGSNQEASEGDSQEASEGSELKKWKCVRSVPASPDVVCTLEYSPVCAYRWHVSGGVTYGNRCEACQQNDNDYYTAGECSGDNQESSEGSNQEEGSEGNNQEASEGSEGSNQEASEGSEGNSQEASEGSNQEASEGDSQEASEGSELKRYKCVRSVAPSPDVVCTLEYSPVCAYHWDEESGTTFGNRCEACQQNDFNYYTVGACSGDNQEEEGSEGSNQEASEGSNQEASEGTNQEEGSEGDNQEEEGSEGSNQEASEGSNQEEGSEGDNQEEEGSEGSNQEASEGSSQEASEGSNQEASEGSNQEATEGSKHHHHHHKGGKKHK